MDVLYGKVAMKVAGVREHVAHCYHISSVGVLLGSTRHYSTAAATVAVPNLFAKRAQRPLRLQKSCTNVAHAIRRLRAREAQYAHNYCTPSARAKVRARVSDFYRRSISPTCRRAPHLAGRLFCVRERVLNVHAVVKICYINIFRFGGVPRWRRVGGYGHN